MSTILVQKPEPYCPAEPTTCQYQATVLTDATAFDAMADEWNTLLQQARVENMSLRHEWISAWLHHFSDTQPRFILVRDASHQLVGAAPLVIQKGFNGLCRRLVRHLQFLGTELSVYDWTTIPIAAGEDQEGVLAAVAEAIHSLQTQWDRIEFHYFAETHQLALLQEKLQPLTYRASISETARMPVLQLPASTMEYLEHNRSKGLKKRVRGGRNRLKSEAQTLTLEFRKPSPETDAILDRFFAQHTAYWTGRGRVSNFIRFPRLADFYKDVFRRSQAFAGTGQPYMNFTVLKANDTHISYQFGFRQDGGYLDYINSFNQSAKQYSPGVLHKEEIILNTIQEGGNHVNFGRGLEEYKELWTNDGMPLWSLILSRNWLADQLCQTDMRLKKLLRKPTA